MHSDVQTAPWPAFQDGDDLLRSAVPADRRRGILAIVHVGGESAVERLSACLFDPDVDVTYDAARALAFLASDAAIRALSRVAEDDACPVVRRVAATAALSDARSTSEHAASALRRLLDTPDRWLRATARQGLVPPKRD